MQQLQHQLQRPLAGGTSPRRLPHARCTPTVRAFQGQESQGRPLAQKVAILVTGLAATCQALNPLPAVAALDSSLFEKSRQLEAELQSIMQERGATLAELDSSPKLADPEPASLALAEVDGVAITQGQFQDLQTDRKALLSRLSEEGESIKAERAKLEAGSAEARAALEAKLAEQDKEVSRLMKELEAVRQQLDSQRQQTVEAEAAVAQADKLLEEARQQMKETTGAAGAGTAGATIPLADVAGLLGALGLAIYLGVARKEGQISAKAEQAEAVAKEKMLVEGALEAQKALAETLRREAATAQEAMQAELAVKDAEASENRIWRNHLKRMLEEVEERLHRERKFAQRLRSEAMRTKAQLAAALADADAMAAHNAGLVGRVEEAQAGRTTAEAEASEQRIWRKHLQRTLDEVNAKAEAELKNSQRLRAEAARTKAQLQALLESNADLTQQNAALGGTVERLQAELAALQPKADEDRLWRKHLQRTLDEVNARLSAERAASQRLRSEAARTKAALLEALAQGAASRAEAQEAAAARDAADAKYAQARAALEEERGLVSQLESELRATQQRLSERSSQLEELVSSSGSLEGSTRVVQMLHGEVRALVSKVAETDRLLGSEQAANAALREGAELLRSELGSVLEALAREQALVEQYKAEAAASAQRQAELEQELRRALALGASALDAEELRAQLAAKEEEAQQDRIWRKHLQRNLEEASTQLNAERESAERLRAEATRSKAALLEALGTSSALQQANAALAEEVEGERARVAELQRFESQLVARAETAEKEARQQQEELEKAAAARDEALARGEAAAGELGMLASEHTRLLEERNTLAGERDAIAEERDIALAKYAAAQEELAMEKARMGLLESELKSTQQDLADLGIQVKQLMEVITQQTVGV